MSSTRRNSMGPRQFTRAVVLAAVLLGQGYSASSQTTTLASTPAPATGTPAWVTSTSDWTEWRSHCSDIFHKPHKREGFFAFASATFSAPPFLFLAQSIVPRPGLRGGWCHPHDPHAPR